jgi:murein endopeptidase
VARLALATALILAALAPAADAVPQQDPVPLPEPVPEIAYRQSIPVGLWWAGKLRRGVQLPAEGPDWFTWDPVLKRKPDRGWRRWGTDRLVRVLLRVTEEYRRTHPEAPRVGIGDLSRPHGGSFGAQYGSLGHASHQNGLDADVYYPRTDGKELRPYKTTLVDRRLAQDLVDRFRAAGAQVIFVGPNVGLHGPPSRVQKLVKHDDHLHVRLPRR